MLKKKKTKITSVGEHVDKLALLMERKSGTATTSQ